jgi:signal transduction histidine kinase
MLDTAGIGTLTVTGTARRTASETAVTVYRTAQEGLTNVVKHAPGASARIDLSFTPDAVELMVTDDGRVTAGPADDLATTGGGYGLGGLRERAGLIGGTLEAGPHEGGWRVALRVPDSSSTSTAPGRLRDADSMEA